MNAVAPDIHVSRDTRASCTAHWSEPYVGLPYHEADCAALAERVQRQVFRRDLSLPGDRACGLRGLSAQIASLKADYAVPVATPRDGDAVLMVARGRLQHIGVYCDIGGVPYVLHAVRNAGQTCLHRIADLGRFGLAIEGYYRWT